MKQSKLDNSTRITIGVSSCLLGENVRFDGGHKKNQYLLNTLTEYFHFHAFCPEVSIGLGIPREPIRLVEQNDEIKCVGTKDETLDVTHRLEQVADEQVSWQESISGYILKKDSPSCGMERVKVYKGVMPERNGIGIYARKLMENFPNLPVEEEGRLNDLILRENFIQRVFVYARWQQLMSQNYSIKDIQQFHAQHKYIYMSHNQTAVKELGGLLANPFESLVTLAQEYITKAMKLLKSRATKASHTNTLQHIQGYLKKYIDADDKQELVEAITEYSNGFVPLIVPITLLRHHFRKYPNEYITQSFYMRPHPSELMLLNNI
ncbi:MAG: DUF523 and DUF1722 domain-containing protein [Thalassotalea sp.]|nr:DUF523 and DUF1722 domain-containing protein [Thalassotalea sp.]